MLDLTDPMAMKRRARVSWSDGPREARQEQAGKGKGSESVRGRRWQWKRKTGGVLGTIESAQRSMIKYCPLIFLLLIWFLLFILYYNHFRAPFWSFSSTWVLRDFRRCFFFKKNLSFKLQNSFFPKFGFQHPVFLNFQINPKFQIKFSTPKVL